MDPEHLLPKPDFFLPPQVKDALFKRKVESAVTAKRSIIHFTHGGCLDGATCDALVRMKHGAQNVSTLYLAPHETLPALDILRAHAADGRRLVVSDLSFQKGQGARVVARLEELTRKKGWRVTWRDHHHKQWDGAPVDAMQRVADVTVDTTGTECGATLVQKDLLPDDAFARELAAVVRDHDLWLRKDPRSIRVQQACQHVGSAFFADHLVVSRSLLDANMDAWARREDARRDALVEEAVGASWFKIGKRAVVGVAYGRVPTNEVLHTLYEEKGAHLAILLKPSGTFSLRSPKGVEVCHLVAQNFGGGGHPNASGGKLRIPHAKLPLYWATRGRYGADALIQRAVDEVDTLLATQ